jgi:hypothetical protein
VHEFFIRQFLAALDDRERVDVSFLKELVKRKRFPSGWLRNGSAGRMSGFPGFVGGGDSCVRTTVSFWGSGSVVVASLREVAIVLF